VLCTVAYYVIVVAYFAAEWSLILQPSGRLFCSSGCLIWSREVACLEIGVAFIYLSTYFFAASIACFTALLYIGRLFGETGSLYGSADDCRHSNIALMA